MVHARIGIRVTPSRFADEQVDNTLAWLQVDDDLAFAVRLVQEFNIGPWDPELMQMSVVCGNFTIKHFTRREGSWITNCRISFMPARVVRVDGVRRLQLSKFFAILCSLPEDCLRWQDEKNEVATEKNEIQSR
jgi:hypothetical protein